jgi:hypothetical protein
MNSDQDLGRQPRACLYNKSCRPCRSALNSPCSLGYLAFGLPSRMPSPALRGSLVMSQCMLPAGTYSTGRERIPGSTEKHPPLA